MKRAFLLVGLMTFTLLVAKSYAGEEKRLNVELMLAKTVQERQKGLMNRRDLHANQGLLMVYEQPSLPCIWAMGTLIDLDVAFINAEHTLIAIEPLKARPHLWQLGPIDREQLEKEAIRASEPCLYVLEMPALWFEKNAIHVGDALHWDSSAPIRQIVHISGPQSL